MVLDLLREVVGHVGLDEARGDHVGRHALAAQFAGNGLGEAHEPRLGRGVVRLPRVAHHAGSQTDVDDPPEAVLHHRPGRSTNGHEGRREVGRDHLVPLVIRHAEGEVVLGDAGVVDENVEPSVRLGDAPDGRGERRSIGNVDGDHAGRTARGLDARLDLVERALTAADEHDVASVPGKSHRDGLADASRRASDNGDTLGSGGHGWFQRDPGNEGISPHRADRDRRRATRQAVRRAPRPRLFRG